SVPTLFATRLAQLTSDTPMGVAKSAGNVITITSPAGTTVTDLGFTDASGNPLNGLDSGLKANSGNTIFLYTEPSNNIALGREGNGSTANASGAVVFAVLLNETKDASNVVTGAELWSVQYKPIDHPLDGTATQGATATTAGYHDDAVDLSGKLFVEANSE